MNTHRRDLARLEGQSLLTDGGLETTLIFLDGIELPEFASFTLLDSEAGRARLERYYSDYARLANRHGRGLLLEAPTWRANRDWGARLGYDPEALARVNREAIGLLAGIRDRHERAGEPMLISGCLGPRGDGYLAGAQMCAAEARDYHREQIQVLARTEADLVSAYTINYVAEAVGIVQAAEQAAIPVVISFTVETDGRLPSGEALADAIVATDAATGGAAAYYMINCAHPTHFAHLLSDAGAWATRIRGIRANASCKSHAELDASTELDIGDPADLGRRYAELVRRMPQLMVVGGCCGTDERHIEAICRATAA
ncbi:MAG: homocysteine S-methyltransferase family protein [Rhodocyclaceae bacterium]|nr:homocysteine S-methyltransferase family protein [Rhodocyclaceae bacterium]